MNEGELKLSRSAELRTYLQDGIVEVSVANQSSREQAGGVSFVALLSYHAISCR